MELWTAIAIGFAGSFHCVGMCGPLALAVPLGGTARPRLAAASYQLGRVATYSLFGLLFGSLGYTVTWAQWQQPFSIALGSLIVVSVLGSRWLRAPRLRGWSRALQGLKQRMGLHLRGRHWGSGFVVGLLNGFLPCGLVYLALAGAMATYHPGRGALYMAAFGLGTLPLMVGLQSLAPLLTPARRARLHALVPYVVATMGILLILRGLHLNIPYLSPLLPETLQAEIPLCD